MRLLAIFKQLLKDIVAELVLSELDALLDQRLENCIFGVGLSSQDDRLDSARTVLVSGPLCRLI